MNLLIGTVNFHTKPFTEVWLKTLYRSILISELVRSGDRIKVVIVNNSPEDNLEDLKKQYPFKNITFIENKENLGVAAAWNQIIKEGFDDEGNPLFDFYMPANNDIYFSSDWVDSFLYVLSVEPASQKIIKEFGWISSFLNDYKEPDLTGVSETLPIEGRYWGGIRPEADDIESAEQIESILKTTYAPVGGIDVFTRGLQSKYKSALREMHPKAPLFALSKECIKKVGLFDEYNSPNGLHEDADYCYRIKRAGLKIGVAFGAYAHHFSMMSRTKGEFKKEWWVASREKAFQEKWGVSSKEMEKIGDKKFRLDIGSGYGPRKDGHWLHMEVDKKFKDIEYLQDISKPLPFEDEEFEEIYASNVLEHVSHADVPAVLFEWIRILKKGGKIEIRVPNMKWICQQYAQGSWVLSFIPGTELNAMHAIFGGDNPGVPHIHKAGFDQQNLSGLLRDCGITEIRDISDPNSWELKMIGTKE